MFFWQHFSVINIQNWINELAITTQVSGKYVDSNHVGDIFLFLYIGSGTSCAETLERLCVLEPVKQMSADGWMPNEDRVAGHGVLVKASDEPLQFSGWAKNIWFDWSGEDLEDLLTQMSALRLSTSIITLLFFCPSFLPSLIVSTCFLTTLGHAIADDQLWRFSAFFISG